jgi:hypothetical protein
MRTSGVDLAKRNSFPWSKRLHGPAQVAVKTTFGFSEDWRGSKSAPADVRRADRRARPRLAKWVSAESCEIARAIGI